MRTKSLVALMFAMALLILLIGDLIFPLLLIALNVQMRRIPEASIFVATFGSAIATVAVLFEVDWVLKILVFYTLSSALYALFAVMIARCGQAS